VKEDVDVVEEVDRLITALQAHPDPAVGEQVRTLLAGIDAVHRTGLEHLLTAIHGMAGEAFVNRLVGDPAIRFLLMSYELLAVDRRLMAEEALDGARAPLHARGIDVEILEVVGGVVYIRLHGGAPGAPPVESILHDLEDALREGFIGFQELVLRDRPARSASSVIPVSSLLRARAPVYQTVAKSDGLAEGALLGCDAGGAPVLLVRVGGEVHALRNRCGESPLPLEFSRVEGAQVVCSWHGCRYDVRSGRTGDGSTRLDVFPVRERDGDIEVAVGTAATTPPESRACAR